MNQSIKKVLLVCSLLFFSSPYSSNAEDIGELVFDNKQGTFQEFLNAQSGDVKVTLNRDISGSDISIPDNITSLDIDLNGYKISNIFANGIPLTISNGTTGAIYGGSKNMDINADPYIRLTKVRLGGNVYGGGYSDSNGSANVKGDVTIIFSKSRATDEETDPNGMGTAYEIYGGGYAVNGGNANVDSTKVFVTDSYTSSIFGGGYASGGTANITNKASLSIDSSTSYGDMVGCGVPDDSNSVTTCGSTKLKIENVYFPVSERAFYDELQSGIIVGGSLSWYGKSNLIGDVFGNVSISVSNTKIYGYINNSGYGDDGKSIGSFSVGSVDLLLDGIVEFYEPRLENTKYDCLLKNDVLFLGGGKGDSSVKGYVNVVIRNSDLNKIKITEDGPVKGNITLELEDGGNISWLDSVNTLILGAPLNISSHIGDPTPIQVELKGKWENDVKAITLGGVADDSLFTGSNLVYGEDTASYWMTAGITDIPVPEPEPDPEPDHSSSSNSGSSSSSTIIKGDTETSVKVDNKNSSLSEKVVKKLVEDNQNVPVVIESKEVKITYPKGAMTEMNEGISLKVEINGKDATTKKAAEVAGETGSMTLNFKEESMFSKNQPIKIEVKAKPELKGKQLYYKKYDEATNQLLFVQPTAVNEDGWLEVSQTEAGCYVVTDSIDPYWQQSITGDWYYFNEQGAIVTGWMADNNNWYYLEDKGTMHVGWLNLDNTWYCTNDNGKLVTGWNPQGDVWYYHDGSGSLVKNEWVWDAGWYYINDEGKMLRDGYTPDGYHVNSSGIYDY